MNIVFNETIGRIYGVFDSLFYAWNLKDHKEKLGLIDFKLDDGLLQDFTIIQEYQKKNHQDMDFFFNYESRLYQTFIRLDLMSQCQSVEEYLMKIQKISEYEIKKQLVNIYIDIHKKSHYEVDEIAKENRSVLEFIKEVDISDKSKWQIFCLLDDIKGSLEGFISLTRRYLNLYNDIYDSNSMLIKERDKHIRDSFDSRDIKPLIEKTDKKICFKDLNFVSISVSYFNTYHFNYELYNDTSFCYIILGRRNSLVTQYIDPKAEFDANILVLKNLSDETRFKIVSFLLTGEKFAQEIAEKVNVSNSTVNYHMNNLALSGLVFTEKRENKVYYAINKEKLRSCIEYLTRSLKL